MCRSPITVAVWLSQDANSDQPVNRAAGDYHQQQIQRRPHPRKIAELQRARAIDHGIGLIADRRQETGRCRQHHRQHQRQWFHT